MACSEDGRLANKIQKVSSLLVEHPAVSKIKEPTDPRTKSKNRSEDRPLQERNKNKAKTKPKPGRLRKRPYKTYCSKAGGRPAIRFHLRLTLTWTRLAILMKGMPLFMPYSLRSRAMVPMMVPAEVPLPESSTFSVSFLVTPRMVKSPSTSKLGGPVWRILGERKGVEGASFAVKKVLPFS